MRAFRYLLTKQLAKQRMTDDVFAFKEHCAACDLRNKIRYQNTTSFQRYFHVNSSFSFWEQDPKGGYGREVNIYSRIPSVREGLSEIKKEIRLWKDEVKEKLQSDPILVYRPGETDIVWNFNSPESLNKWVTTSDSDFGEGFSCCSLSLAQSGKCLFSGTLKTQVPKDGKIKKAGYCNMKSMRIRKSFMRETFYDWQPYNCIVLRIRGDGRSYLLNISTSGQYDIMWNDMYHYVLYTRGGPYWQVAKIPFSKFLFGSKGRVQDKQSPIPLSRVTHFGISVADAINGPFRLEIDYIGVEYDPTNKEEFAYEMYKTDKFIAGY